MNIAGPAAAPRRRRAFLLVLAAIVLALAANVVPLSSSALFVDASDVAPNGLSTATLAPPTGVTAGNGSTITLSWTASTSTRATGYRVYRSTTSGTLGSLVATVTPVTATTWTDASPPAGTSYYVIKTYVQNWNSSSSTESAGTKPVGVTWTSISASWYGASCGVRSDGNGYCWGMNDQYELGNGTTTASTVPTLVSGGYAWQDIQVGSRDSNTEFACGLTTGSKVYCWGAGTNGELGNGSTTANTTPGAVSGTYKALSVGGQFVCALTTAGKAYCWGANDSNQLGTGATSTYVNAPAAVNTSQTFVSISSAQAHTCAIDAAGVAYCWGYGAAGRLGNGNTSNSASPTPVSGGYTWSSITTGYRTTCGVTTTGAAYCWGYGTTGQLGNGTSASTTAPTTPVSGYTFASISGGWEYNCGVTTTGVGLCWGTEQYGSFGDTTANGAKTTPSPVTGGFTWATINAGGNTTCGTTTAGAAYCWGYGGSGELGRNSTASSTTPVAVNQPS